MKKDIIRKSNSLTVAYYNLTLVEYRILHMAFTTLADIEPNPALLRKARFAVRASDYMELYDVDRATAYQALKEASERLFNRYFTYDIEISPEHQLYERLKARWVTKVGYIDKEATVTLYLSEEVLSMIGKLDNRYTTYFLNQTSELSSMYAVRIYEMIMQWRKAKIVPMVGIDELRRILDIKPDEYSRMYDFKKYVLDTAIKQINEHTDIIVSYEQYKQGRNIAGITFKFKPKPTKKKTTAPSGDDRDANTVDMLTPLSMSDKQRKFFGRKLAELSDLSDLATGEANSSYDAFGAWIADDLLKPERAEFYRPYLEQVGFS